MFTSRFLNGRIFLILILGSILQVNAFNLYDYNDALDKSTQFYDVQRSGKLPSWQRITWRKDSALSDGSSNNVDLTGGYYDAGDNVKYGFPMAFTITLLSWSVIEFQDELRQAGQFTHIMNAIRWGTDYFLKAYTSPTELYVQVGDIESDHNCWERPEDMDTSRATFKIDANNPGSEVVGETAAALAAASIAFQSMDIGYFKELLANAQQLFQFADMYCGNYSEHYSAQVCPYYCSYNGYEDELVWAAMWLFKATKDSKYQQYILNNMDKISTWKSDAFNWDDKMIGVKILLSNEKNINVNDLQNIKDQFNSYICNLLPKTVLPNSYGSFTPGGLLYHSDIESMQYVTTNIFLLAVHAKYLHMSSKPLICNSFNQVESSALLNRARRQVDYILGDNPLKISYMVGFGSKYPSYIHHRAASLPSMATHPARIDCDTGHNYFALNNPDFNVAVGAIVGGPDAYDNFSDTRSNANGVQTEPATYINAPLIGVLALFASGTNY